jgi:hypothetical protein
MQTTREEERVSKRAQVAGRIAAMRREGMTFAAIAGLLNQAGVRPFGAGRRWYAQTVRAVCIRELDGAGVWTRTDGRWSTQDGRFRVDALDGDPLRWLVEATPEGDRWVAPFQLFRDLKNAVAAIYAEEIEKGRELLVEIDEIEAGEGLIYRLRLRDGLNNTFATAYARRGKVGLEVGLMNQGPDLNVDKANGVAALLQQAAALAEQQREEER